MDRLDLDKAYAPLEPITWPGGGEQAVKRITWRVQEMVADMQGDEAKMRESMPKIMTALLPGRTWDEIADTLDSQQMLHVVAYASGAYHQVAAELEADLGNGVAGTVTASAPPAPAATSVVASPAPTAVPCGAS